MGKNIICIKLINDRLMYIQIEHTTPITIIICDCPQAGRPAEEKEEVYEQIWKITSDTKSKWRVFIGGDFNARLLHSTPAEEEFMGTHIFNLNEATLDSLSEGQKDNRDRFVQMCTSSAYQVASTFCSKKHRWT